ncbi:hypothetical protein RhiirA4_468188 [Rhizophagus irregularis]|uniref:Uncharacterized protein n=1 Tax=Rhizophagus irregularis TaxID=588596 RepID=A0A2I1GXB4_9GLOM|nr:hypothetical protein RhiirA4_468188 [Rhizophagus irregularis]
MRKCDIINRYHNIVIANGFDDDDDDDDDCDDNGHYYYDDDSDEWKVELEEGMRKLEREIYYDFCLNTFSKNTEKYYGIN